MRQNQDAVECVSQVPAQAIKHTMLSFPLAGALETQT